MPLLRALPGVLLATLPLLAPAAAAADRFADAIHTAADRVIAAVHAGDAEVLRALATQADPDPWFVADQLIVRGAREAAVALAKAGPGPDLEALPDYVRAAGDPAKEGAARGALAAALRALEKGDHAGGLSLAVVEEPAPETIVTVHLRLVRATALRSLKRMAEATDAFEAASAAALRLGWLSQAAAAADSARYVCWRIPDLKRALAFAERVVALQERRRREEGVTHALVHVGAVLDALGDQRRALEVMEKALARHEAAGNRGGVATAVGNLGVIRWKLGELDEAVRLQERALALAEEQKDRAQKARTLGRLAVLYRDRGDLPRSLASAMSAAKDLGELGFGGEAALALVTAANANRLMGNDAEAIGKLDRALVVARQVGDTMAEAHALSNLGTLKGQLGDEELSIRLKEQAMAIWERAGDRRGLAGGLIRLAGDHVDRRQADKAFPLLDRAQKLAEDLRNTDLLTRVDTTRAEAFLALWKRTEARQAAESATRRADAQGNLEGVARAWRTLGDVLDSYQQHAPALAAYRRSSEAARRMRLSHARIAALAGEARALRALNDLRGAVAAAREVAGETETLALGQDEESAAITRKRGMWAFDQGALAAQALNDVESVVFFFEAGRAGALLTALGTGDVLRAEDLPEALAKADAEARAAEAAALARFTRALADRAEDVETHGAALDEARERRRELSRRIQRWARLSGGGAAPGVAPLEELQRGLAPGDVLVLYSYLGANVVAAVIRPKDARVVTLDLRAKVSEALDAAMPPTQDVVAPAAVKAARTMLLGPLGLKPADRRLLISPDDRLDHVPFALLEPDREIVLVPSGSVLGLLRARNVARGKGVLALGDPAIEAPGGSGGRSRAGLGLPRLEAAAAEARAVGDVVLLGDRASEQGLRDALATRPRWRAVHLACHGLIDREKPLLSSLVLAPSGDDDGLLTGHEILRLRVPTDLVVLSGCETARGKAFWGEGVVGFTRAFLLAGAQRVLASLWKVDDEATRVFMEEMHARWKKGDRLEAALQHARARLKADPRWSHAKHWSAFVLWGLPE